MKKWKCMYNANVDYACYRAFQKQHFHSFEKKKRCTMKFVYMLNERSKLYCMQAFLFFLESMIYLLHILTRNFFLPSRELYFWPYNFAMRFVKVCCKYVLRKTESLNYVANNGTWPYLANDDFVYHLKRFIENISLKRTIHSQSCTGVTINSCTIQFNAGYWSQDLKNKAKIELKSYNKS